MARESAGELIDVLLIEDSATDVFLAREALKHSALEIQLHVVNDGVDGLAYLRREGRFKDAAQPKLVLLDLNLPKKDGREVLLEIKSDPKLKVLPVVVLTTSQAEYDILTAYERHANCYIVKPVDFDKFAEIVQTIEAFWFGVATLPKAT